MTTLFDMYKAECKEKEQRISELESALQHIRDFYYSAEMCRDIAAAALDGRDDYKEPPR